jgi:hypothetical protein
MRAAILLLTAAFLAGCGGGRDEALQLTKTLSDRQADFAKADAIEKDAINSAKAWCSGIVANGAGKGAELDQNGVVATELAKSISEASNILGQVRQAITDQHLEKEFNQNVRNDLLNKLMQRQRRLQDMRTLLQQAAPQFAEYKRNKSYAGDTYPGEIGKLDSMLQAYKEPENAVGTALAALKEEYGI